LFTRAFWEATVERATKTAAQAACTVLVVDYTDWVSFEANAGATLAAAGIAGAFSVLTSIGSAQVGTRGSPSLTPGAEVKAATSAD
jgi:hypothetical protein